MEECIKVARTWGGGGVCVLLILKVSLFKPETCEAEARFDGRKLLVKMRL